MIWSKYNIDFQIKDSNSIGVYNTYSNSFIEIEKKLYAKINEYLENSNNNLPAETLNKLKANSILTKNDEDIFNILRYKYLSSIFSFNTLELTIAPTADCNFNCPYCFEKNKPNIYMNKTTADNIINFIKSFNKKTEILWFGGEPLLNFNRIKYMSNILTTQNIDFSASIITNGYLLDENKIKEFKNLKINNVQITFDGLSDTHNKRRRHKKGYPTFNKILNNIDTLYKYTIKDNIFINITITIDETNKNEFSEIFVFLKDRYSELFNRNLINIPFNFVESRTNQANNCKMNNSERLNFILELFENNKIPKAYVLKYLYPKQNIHPCMMRKINSFGIGASGNIYKCLEDFDNEQKSLGNLNNKKIDTLKLASLSLKKDVFEDKICQECIYLPLCGGGCPYDLINNTRKNYSENCVLFKERIPEILSKYYFYTR
ncbi:MAG: radical SAM protein [Bacteroidales bacterium]|nr:radical SAM protein [Bacteroidales bacterium]